METAIVSAPQSDLDIESLRHALEGRLVGRQIFHYDLVSSTMDVARSLAEEGVPEGIIVIAEEQTRGRGRFHRAWIAPRGENLAFSIAALRPTALQLPQVNMAATLAVVNTVESFTGEKPGIKWPNDVRIHGRKVAGILMETELERGEVGHAIVGIGVNVNFDPSRYAEIAAIATSIFRETGKRADRTAVLCHLLVQLDELYASVKEGRLLTNDWALRLETLGRTVQVRWEDRVIEGQAEAVDDQGNLIVLRPDGSVFTAVAGEVTLQV